MKTPAKPSYLSVGTIVAMNLAIIMNLYGFPSEAFYGLSSIALYLIALLIFLVPVALVSAELGSMYPNGSGIFTWVKAAFNYKPGLVATWLQWLQSILFYPLSLTFAAVTFCYIFPDMHIVQELQQNKVYIICFTLVIFWGCTLLGTLGMRHIGKLSTWGVWIGIIIPVALLIGLAIYYVCSGGHIQMNTDPSTLIPKFNSFDSVVLAASILLFYSGLEVNGVHIYLMKNPSRDYPKALFFSCIAIGAIYILGTLAIAVVIPNNDLNITESVIVSFKELLHYIRFGWFAVTVIAVAMVFGVLANTITWISGPASVVKDIAYHGYLPKAVNKQNRRGAPLFILYTQAIIVSILMFVYAISPKVEQGYQMLIQMANAIYLTMYVIFYISFLRLRYRDKTTVRPFRVGRKGNWFAWVVAMVGLIGAVSVFFLSFLPPTQLGIAKAHGYVGTLIIIYLCLIAPPFIYLLFRHNIKPNDPVMPNETPAQEAIRKAAERARTLGLDETATVAAAKAAVAPAAAPAAAPSAAAATPPSPGDKPAEG